MAKKRSRSIRTVLLAVISRAVICLLGLSTKTIFRNREIYTGLRDKGKHPLLAFWHGRQFFGYFPHRGERLVIPASLSSDGDIVEMVLGNMGHIIVRGSSSKGAARLLVQMVKGIQAGHGLALSVDGPRGPYRTVKMGIIKVAQKTGNPVVPMVCSSSRMWISRKSWDNFMLPKPFSRVLIRYMEPLYIPQDADRDELETYRQKLEEMLKQGYREVDEYFGFPELEDELHDS